MGELGWDELVPPAPPPRRRRWPLALAVLAVLVVAIAAPRLWALRPGPPVDISEAFPDDALASCVARELGVDVAATVSTRDLEGVEQLDCSHGSLTSTGTNDANRSAPKIRALDGVERMVGLEDIRLAWQEVESLRPLASLPRLAHLNLAWVPITDLTGVESMKALTWLEIWGQCFTGSDEPGLTDITPLEGAERLENLDLMCTDVSDLAPLAGLDALRSLSLGGTRVKDLSPLAGLPTLRYLYLNGTPVTDVSPLAGIETLRSLSLRGTDVTDVSALDDLPELEISY